MKTSELLSCLGIFIVLCFVSISQAEIDRNNTAIKGGRKGKLFSIFQVVSFANDACDGSSENGTCYTEGECAQRGGQADTTCAQGFGVCCIFRVSCGQTSSENCTYFESNGVTTGGCSADICPVSDGICQLRLDFASFAISGPSTATASVAKTLFGRVVDPAQAGAKSAAVATQCLIDTFQVASVGGSSASDVICGTNNNEHLYVDMSDGCVRLAFQLSSGSTQNNRQWNIKATQFSCMSPNRAPAGCDQYFFGPNTNMIRTFNYNGANGGRHLANQDQTICIRREAPFCRICFTAAMVADFALSGKVNAALKGMSPNDNCCNYGLNGQMTNGADCVAIPGAEPSAVAAAVAPVESVYCGQNSGLANNVVCSRATPFMIRFVSDNFEFAAGIGINSEAITANRGFQLTYTMDAINCDSTNP